MEVKVENLKDSKTKVNVTVDAADVDRNIKAVYRELANKHTFPGFRKGKAPRQVIDNTFGKDVVLAQATEDVVNEAYPKVIEQEKLFPVGSPDFGETENVVPGESFSFEFMVGAKPDVTLTSYDPVEIELPFQDATDIEIDQQVDLIAHHYEDYVDAPAKTKFDADNVAELSVKATKEDGTEIAPLTSDKMLFTPGAGLYSEAYEKELFGMKAGDEKSFTLDIPEDEESLLFSDLAGQKVSFDVKCDSVKTKSVPEVTDEWVKKSLGFDDVKALRENIAHDITEQKIQMMPQMKENACKLKLIERVDAELPAAMLEESESELLQDFFSQLQQRGLSFDQYLQASGVDSDQFKEDVKLQAADEAKQQVALDAWAKKKGIEATEEDIKLEFERSGVDEPQKTMQRWIDNGRMYLIREGITRRKAMDDVIETAKVTEVDFAKRNKERKDEEEKGEAKSKKTSK